jgi:hypothetical protein
VKYHFLFSTFLILFFSSCDNPFGTTPGTQGKNIVTGIYMTSVFNDRIGIWGNPNFPVGIEFEPEVVEDTTQEEQVSVPLFFRMETPYPNPADGNMYISVSFPKTFHVKVWMETASLNISQTESISGIYSPGTFQKYVLFDGKISTPGQYQFLMDKSTKCFGGELNQGFFRVFVQVDGKYTLWKDIYIGGFREKAPPAFRNFNGAYPCSDYPDQINN